MTEKSRKTTDELLKQLVYNNVDIQQYINENKNSLIEVNLKEFWDNVMQKTTIRNADIINKSNVGYTYFYDVISGRKIPSADKIIRLCLAMELTLDECNTVLRYCGKSRLYPRFKRDSILIYAIVNHYSVNETNKLLKEADECVLR